MSNRKKNKLFNRVLNIVFFPLKMVRFFQTLPSSGPACKPWHWIRYTDHYIHLRDQSTEYSLKSSKKHNIKWTPWWYGDRTLKHIRPSIPKLRKVSLHLFILFSFKHPFLIFMMLEEIYLIKPTGAFSLISCQLKNIILEVQPPYDLACPSRMLVRRLVGWLVCHNFLKGRDVTLPCSYRTTCFSLCGSLDVFLITLKNGGR